MGLARVSQQLASTDNRCDLSEWGQGVVMDRRSVKQTLILFVCALLPVFTALAGTDQARIPAVGASARFILQLGILVFAAKIGGALFTRGRLPLVLGELSAGVLVGPYLLGGVALPFFPEGVMGQMTPLTASHPAFHGIMSVTLAVFFFLAGLNTDLRQIRRYSVGGIVAGLCGFLFSFGVAWGGLVWGADVLMGRSYSWYAPELMLCAAVVSVTSIGVLARLLADERRLESLSGTVALTAAMTDNVLGLLFFTVLAGIVGTTGQHGQSDFSQFVWIGVRTCLGLGGVAILGIPLAHHMNQLAMREKNYTQAFVVSAACLLIAGGLIGACGLPVMSGAYVLGCAFSPIDFRHEIRERLDFVSMVLVPACFAALGMQFNPNLLANLEVLGVAVLFAGAVVLAKLLGSAGGGALAGLNRAGCLRVGMVTLPRGELSLALLVAVTGMGVLSEPLFFALITLIVLSCVAVPFLTDHPFVWGQEDARTRYPMPDPVRISFRFQSQQASVLMVNRVVALFEDEGFYAQLLNRSQTLYRISRATQVIHLHQTGGNVLFECTGQERALINTVMLEVASAVEQSLRELRSPLDDLLLRRNMQSSEPSTGSGSVILRNHVVSETCRPQLKATTKQGVIEELVNVLYDNGLVADSSQALQAVLNREQNLSTGLEYGLALPHARTDAVGQLVCAVGLKREGVDFDAADGRPTRIVVLVLAPEHVATPQLQMIAQICRTLDECGRAALLACETPEDMAAVLMGGVTTPKRNVKTSVLADYLVWQSISLDLTTGDKMSVLDFLLALCARSGSVGDIDEIRQDVQVAVDDVPVSIGESVVVYPVRTKGVARVVLSLGVSIQGVGLEKTKRVWIMALYPPSAEAAYATVLMLLKQVLTGERLVELLQAHTSREAWTSITTGGSSSIP